VLISLDVELFFALNELEPRPSRSPRAPILNSPTALKAGDGQLLDLLQLCRNERSLCSVFLSHAFYSFELDERNSIFYIVDVRTLSLGLDFLKSDVRVRNSY
jgi:hypothetical protein